MSEPKKCRGCIHPEHRGVCGRIHSQTCAWRCGCITPPEGDARREAKPCRCDKTRTMTLQITCNGIPQGTQYDCTACRHSWWVDP